MSDDAQNYTEGRYDVFMNGKNVYVMDDLEITEEFGDFGKFHYVYIDDEIYFIGVEFCRALGYQRESDALGRRVSPENRITSPFRRGDSKRISTVVLLSEAGVYELIMRSNAPNAKAFKDVVLHDILPSIRRRHAELTADKIEEIVSNPDTAREYLTEMANDFNKLTTKLNDETKYRYMLETAEGSCSVGTLAKTLAQRGYNIGQKRLFDWLRCNKYLSNQASSYNVPLQWAIDQGLFEVNLKKLINYTTKNPKKMGHVPMITVKGQIKIIEDFIKSYAYTKQAMRDNPASDYDTEGLLHLRPVKGGKFDKFQKEYWKRHGE